MDDHLFCKSSLLFLHSVLVLPYYCLDITLRVLRSRHVNIRVGEDSGVSPLTGKKRKAKTTAAIKDHMLICDHVVSLKAFKILASSNSEFHLKIKKSILKSCDKPG